MRSVPVNFLTLDEIIAIHADQIQRYGGSLGLRDRSLLEAALAAGDAAAARPVLDWLAQTGLRHVRIQALVDQLAGAA